MNASKAGNQRDQHVNEEKKRAELKAAIIKKKEYQSKVMIIVERLLENPVDRIYFEEKAILIDPATYQDVVEERAIQKFCGYPLCVNQLSNVPKQQFKISLKSNKVYDITDRKNFCCNGCYQASCHLKGQLLTSPIWTRDINERIKLSFLPHGGSSNLVGEEVQLVGRISPKDIEFRSIHDAMSALADEIDDMSMDGKEVRKSGLKSELKEPKSVRFAETKVINEEKPKPNEKTYRCISNDGGLDSVEREPECQAKEKQVTSHSQVEETERARKVIKRKTSKPKAEKAKVKGDSESAPLPSLHVEKTFQEWFTLDSLRIILGGETVDAILAEREKAREVESKSEELDSERYARLLERLDRMDQEEGIFDSQSSSVPELQPKRPLPSYEELKKETEEATAKVAAFMAGKTVTENFAAALTVKEKTEDRVEGDEKPIFLPPIDSHSQNALRRQIVLSRLHLVIPDLMRTFDMGDVDISEEVRNLALTFKFSAENIVHEPYHWSLIGLALIYFASRQDHMLRVKIEAEAAQKYIKMMLLGFNLDAGYLDRLMSWLTDETLKGME